MALMKLVPIRFENGIWEGHCTGNTPPQVAALFLGQPLPGVEVAPVEDGWRIRVPVPSALLSDGVHTVILWDEPAQQKLGDFTVIAGAPAVGDIRSEIDLLRAELDLLKRVVRRLHLDHE